MAEQQHEAIELRLPKAQADFIYLIAEQADVTPEQAASVLAVLALRKYLAEVTT